MVKRYHCEDSHTIDYDDNGDYVLYEDYAKLESALRECVHQIECVMDYYTIHPIDRPKLVYTLRQAREVLGDA